MNEEVESCANGFLSASQLLKVKGIGSVAWDDWHQSEIALPKTGKKYFEPNGSWLQCMQLENGLKNRKRLLGIERVDRSSQLALAEWSAASQKAKVTKKSGQKWENFGHEDKSQLYLLPEEALILLEMNCLELRWNGMPLSVQQAYEVLINSENSKCTQDEYRVYSQLIRWGYKLQRFRDKSPLDNKMSNTAKRIIMNPDGLWTPNTSATTDKQVLDNNDCIATTRSISEQEDDVITISKINKLDSEISITDRKTDVISDETESVHSGDSMISNQVSKWPGSRIQRNIKLMPKRNEKMNISNLNSELQDQCFVNSVPEKRRNPSSAETVVPSKKSRPEIIELSDDEIEEIPRQMSRMEILNTLPNLAGAGNESVIAEIPRGYIPLGIKPMQDFYRYDRNRLLNLSERDSLLKSDMQVVPMNNNSRNGEERHFYSQRNQCQSDAAYGSNNGYTYRGMRCQREGNSFIQQNISHNTIHSPYSGTVYQSNCVNFVMEVMGSMVRSFRQQQFEQTTICQNLQIFNPRYSFTQQRFQSYPLNFYNTPPPREQYYSRRGGNAGVHAVTSQRGKSNRYGSGNDYQRTTSSSEEPSQPSFMKHPGVASWLELKRKWRDESTITIEDEEPVQADDDTTVDNSEEVQVVEESISPLICSKSSISNLSEVYERLRIIKSATDRTVRSRKVHYNLSYEVYPVNQHYKKTSPGIPICRLYIINSKKDLYLDCSKLQRLQQESKDVPVVVAFVSRSSISYTQLGVVLLPNES